MLVDSHAHLDMPVFADDLPQVLARCREAGVERVVDIVSPFEKGGLARLREAARAASFPVAFCSGVHPHDALRFTSSIGDELLRFACEEGCGFGEIGLDYHYMHSPPDAQRAAFLAQLGLARKAERPVVVHSREADADTLACLKDAAAQDQGGVIHCFTGGPRLAEGALALGFCISFSGIVTFKNAGPLREIARAIPLDRLLVETDAPYLAPAPHRGQRNEPARVRRVAEAVAAERGLTIEELATRTRANTLRLFRLGA